MTDSGGSNRQATVLVLLVVIMAVLLFGKGKLPRAWGALWGPPSVPSGASDADKGAISAAEAADAQSIVKGLLAFGVAALIVLALADTPAYPAALGALLVALLYLLLSGGGLAAVSYLDQLLTSAPKAAPAAAGGATRANGPRKV